MALFNHELAEEDPALLACGVVFIALKTLEQVDSAAQPEGRLGDIGRVMGSEEEQVLEVSRKVLELAKNFSKFYPSLGNLKKFNKFEYGIDWLIYIGYGWLSSPKNNRWDSIIVWIQLANQDVNI